MSTVCVPENVRSRWDLSSQTWLTSLERIADHCSNISVCVTQVRENLYDTHSHLESLKNEPDEGYYNRLEELQREYVLP